MLAEPLRRVLASTGYLANGSPAPGVKVGREVQRSRTNRLFDPDACWRGRSALTVYFKFTEDLPNGRVLSSWHREVWNEGFSPLLWIVSPETIELYNGFGRPESETDAAAHRLRIFQVIEDQLTALDHLAGRLAMETGEFWQRTDRVTHKTSVDTQLLSDLAALEYDLIAKNLEPRPTHALIGRSVFTQYLIDRHIVNSDRLHNEFGETGLSAILRQPEAARRLFNWLAETFNGDMFVNSGASASIGRAHLSRVADFLDAVDPVTRQTTFFPYRFDVIPIELISSIYEQFAHSNIGLDRSSPPDTVNAKLAGQSKQHGVHYTRLPVVALILDEVLADASGDETVLDFTCGSGVFLVEALRRLVKAKGGNQPSRTIIRDVLYNQICGVDISGEAIRVASFSLYLAALELDPDPQPPEALRFEPLIGRTLLVGDANDIEITPEGAPLLREDGTRREFDVIVGNPPWTFRGKQTTAQRRRRARKGIPRQPRGVSLDFIVRAGDFAHAETRYGMVVSATPFFAGSATGAEAAFHVVNEISPATLVNLAAHTQWLFPTASMPAMIVLTRQRPQDPTTVTAVNVPWSPSAEKSHTFSITPGDAAVLPLSQWASDPKRLKTVLFGRGRDVALLDDLRTRFTTLASWLSSVGSEMRVGLIRGSPQNRRNDASHLNGLELLTGGGLRPFQLPSDMPRFRNATAERPRDREIYRAPLMIIKELLRADPGPRPIAAVASRDLVYTNSYFGASLPEDHRHSAHLIAAILGSAVSAWFLLMTGSDFGVWKRRILMHDLDSLPLPDPEGCLKSPAGQRLLRLAKGFRHKPVSSSGWQEIDKAVFDLYGLDYSDRVVVTDGLLRAGRQWKAGRMASSAHADTYVDLKFYADTFLNIVDGWLEATATRHIRAEVFDFPREAALRVVRFIVGEGRQDPSVKVVTPQGELSDVLERIARRLSVRISDILVGEREIRVHGADEVVVVKPAARRFWMRATALEDADAVVSESFAGVLR